MIDNPVRVDIDVYKDRDFKKTIVVNDSEGEPIDMTSWTFNAQIRPTLGSTTLLAQFVIDETATVSGTIVLSLADTTIIDLEIINAIALGSVATSANAAWDLVVVDSLSDRYSLIEGIATIHETVSRAVV
jgi:hypothetical protein